MNVSDNLSIQNVIGDLKKSLQDKRSELSQCVASISDFERQLQILDISLKEKIETNMILTTRLAGLFSSLETVEKKRDNEMRFHSNLLRKLQICEDIEKELRSKMHKETLNRLNNHVGVFNQMTEKSKISMHLGKGGEFTGTKEDIDEGLDNYVYRIYLISILLESNVLNFYSPKFCSRILIQFLESKFSFSADISPFYVMI